MMKIKVRLFGILGRKCSGYDPQRGLEMELPEGARVGDLLARLGLSEGNTPVVAVENLIRSPQDELFEGAVVHVLQAFYGG